MIKAEFKVTDGKTVGFTVSGHAGFAESGNDIVCAGVSSAVMLTVNAITENLKIKADCADLGNEIQFELCEKSDVASSLLDALKSHLEILSKEFSGTITIENMEV